VAPQPAAIPQAASAVVAPLTAAPASVGRPMPVSTRPYQPPRPVVANPVELPQPIRAITTNAATPSTTHKAANHAAPTSFLQRYKLPIAIAATLLCLGGAWLLNDDSPSAAAKALPTPNSTIGAPQAIATPQAATGTTPLFRDYRDLSATPT